MSEFDGLKTGSETEVIGPAFIFARGGSKGVPDKNIRSLGGQPLIARAIKCALSSQYVDQVIVSTDCDKIAEVAREYGASVPFMRPEHLATDTSPEILSWRHAIVETEKRRDQPLPFFLSVPATSPFRETIDLDRCVERFVDKAPDLVITVTASPHSPWFNMVRLDSESSVRPLVPKVEGITRRQDAPQSFNITTVAYVADPQYVKRTLALLDGDVKAVEVPEERALDIDTAWDFQLAESIIANTN